MFETIKSLNRNVDKAQRTTDPYATTIRETVIVYSYVDYCRLPKTSVNVHNMIPVVDLHTRQNAHNHRTKVRRLMSWYCLEQSDTWSQQERQRIVTAKNGSPSAMDFPARQRTDRIRKYTGHDGTRILIIHYSYWYCPFDADIHQ